QGGTDLDKEKKDATSLGNARDPSAEKSASKQLGSGPGDSTLPPPTPPSKPTRTKSKVPASLRMKARSVAVLPPTPPWLGNGNAGNTPGSSGALSRTGLLTPAASPLRGKSSGKVTKPAVAPTSGASKTKENVGSTTPLSASTSTMAGSPV